MRDLICQVDGEGGDPVKQKLLLGNASSVMIKLAEVLLLPRGLQVAVVYDLGIFRLVRVQPGRNLLPAVLLAVLARG